MFITCENCYTEYQVPMEQSGDRVTCPCCESTFIPDWGEGFSPEDEPRAMIEFLGDVETLDADTPAPGTERPSIESVLDEVPTKPGASGSRPKFDPSALANREELKPTEPIGIRPQFPKTPDVPKAPPPPIPSTGPSRQIPVAAPNARTRLADEETPILPVRDSTPTPMSRPVAATPVTHKLVWVGVGVVVAFLLTGGIFAVLPNSGSAPAQVNTIERLPAMPGTQKSTDSRKMSENR